MQLQQLQAQVVTLVAAIANGDMAGVIPSSTAVVDGTGLGAAAVHEAPQLVGTVTTADSTPLSQAAPLQATAFNEPQPPVLNLSSLSGSASYLKLGNGKLLSFSKQSIPDPPSISFSKDIPQLMRMWDDCSAEWSPSEAVLHIQGEPIALMYWKDLYCYGKSGQWKGTKKNWAHWEVSASPYLPFWD